MSVLMVLVAVMMVMETLLATLIHLQIWNKYHKVQTIRDVFDSGGGRRTEWRIAVHLCGARALVCYLTAAF